MFTLNGCNELVEPGNKLNCGPSEATKRLRVCAFCRTQSVFTSSFEQAAITTEEDRALWTQAACNEAILGSCPSSLDSVKSGIRCWLKYAAQVGLPHLLLRHTVTVVKAVQVLELSVEDALPPTLEGLLSWSRTFRFPWPSVRFWTASCRFVLHEVQGDLFQLPHTCACGHALDQGL